MGKFDQLLEKIGWGQVQEEDENEEETGIFFRAFRNEKQQ